MARLFTPELELDIAGLERSRRGMVRAVRRQGLGAVADTAREVEQALERATQGAVEGRLWRAWSSRVYADDLASIVYVKGGRRTRAGLQFAGGSGRLAAKDGGPTAIPLPAAGAVGRDRNLTPEEWMRRTGLRLRLVKRPGRFPILVADEALLGRSGRATPSRSRRQGPGQRGRVTVPIFVIMPPRGFSGEFSIDAIAKQGQGRLVGNFQQRVGRLSSSS